MLHFINIPVETVLNSTIYLRVYENVRVCYNTNLQLHSIALHSAMVLFPRLIQFKIFTPFFFRVFKTNIPKTRLKLSSEYSCQVCEVLSFIVTAEGCRAYASISKNSLYNGPPTDSREFSSNYSSFRTP
jgi:hypothetical protein